MCTVVSTSNLINDNEMGVELGYNLSLIQINVVVVRGSVHEEDVRYAIPC